MARRKGEKAEPNPPSSVPVWLPVVIELTSFSHRWDQYRLTDQDRTLMLDAILSGPEAWPVQKGTAGARKARFSSHDLDSGASGGYRVFYAVFRKFGKVVLVTLFPKNVQANLSKAGQNLVAELLREIDKQLEKIDQVENAGTPKRKR